MFLFLNPFYTTHFGLIVLSVYSVILRLLWNLTYSVMVILRKPSVFLSVSTLAALSLIVCIALLSSSYISFFADVLSKRVSYGLGLVISDHGEVMVCQVFVEGISSSVESYIVVAKPNSTLWRFLRVSAPKDGEALAGLTLSQKLNIKGKDNIGVLLEDSRLNYSIIGVYRFNNFLDVALLVADSSIDCKYRVYYNITDYNPVEVIRALNTQISYSLRYWYYISLIALIIASILSTAKSQKDLEHEIRELEAQGYNRVYVAITYPIILAVSTSIGSSYGIVIFDIIVSSLGAHFKIYYPPPPLTLDIILDTLIKPTLAAMASSLMSGAVFWRS